MNKLSLHTKIGLIMVVPMLLWVVTGFIFLIKPGYEQAYEQLSPKLYPIEKQIIIPDTKQWNEIKLIKTSLGYHLLVKDSNTAANLDPETFEITSLPSEEMLFKLINDSTSHNRSRYGKAVSVDGNKITTDKNVTISLDWDTMTFRQKGHDTRLIKTLYRIHYLQWFGEPKADKALGFIGLLLLFCLVALGIYSYANRRTYGNGSSD